MKGITSRRFHQDSIGQDRLTIPPLAQEQEVLGRIKASIDDPLALEVAGHAIFDLYPERRGNLFGDEVYRLVKAPDATKFCAMAKMYVTDASFDVANQCLQLHGGYGYLADYGIEKIVRDLRVHQILEGTNEIMRLIVSRQMLTERG